jgi:hypothetical protein
MMIFTSVSTGVEEDPELGTYAVPVCIEAPLKVDESEILTDFSTNPITALNARKY